MCTCQKRQMLGITGHVESNLYVILFVFTQIFIQILWSTVLLKVMQCNRPYLNISVKFL